VSSSLAIVPLGLTTGAQHSQTAVQLWFTVDGEAVSDRDQTIHNMADLWEQQVMSDNWPKPLRRIFAHACLAHVRLSLAIRPVLGLVSLEDCCLSR